MERQDPAEQAQAVRPVRQASVEQRIPVERQATLARRVPANRQVPLEQQAPLNRQYPAEQQIPVNPRIPMERQVSAARRAPDTVLRSIPRRRRPAAGSLAGSVSREANYYEPDFYENAPYEKPSGEPFSRGTSLLTGRQDAAPTGEPFSRGAGGHGRGRDNVKPFAAAPIAYLNPDGPQVWEWMNQGMSVLEISRRLNLTQGEVLLRLNLEKKRMLSNGTGS
jgi:hypothetical protein